MSTSCPVSTSAESPRPVTTLRLASLVGESPAKSPPEHSRFLAMLPTIRAEVRVAFRGLPAEAREEAVVEAIANAFVAYARLVELGK